MFFFAFVALPWVAVSAQPQPPADIPVDSAARTAVIEALLKELNKGYVFPDIAKKMEADIRGRASRGEYDELTSGMKFAEKLTADLRAISKDKHLSVRHSARPIPVRAERTEPTAEERQQFERQMRLNNYGFRKVENLPGNIGYVEFRGFLDPKLGAETVRSAMAFLRHSDAIIFDLRENGGGDPKMVAHISSYLFGDEPVHLNDLYWREGDKTEEFWTDPKMAEFKMANTPVYVLTAKRTFSGAEEFSYNLKNLKRGTIVGETTGGGAHPGDNARLTEHFSAFIPSGRAISPITKTNWEGTGVEPDIKVPKEQALHVAQIEALKHLQSKATDDWKPHYSRRIAELEKQLDEIKAGVKTATK